MLKQATLTFFFLMTFLMIVVRVFFSFPGLSPDELPSFFLVDEATLILRVTNVVVFFVPEALALLPADFASVLPPSCMLSTRGLLE